MDGGTFSNISQIGNKLIYDYGNTTTIEHTISSEGISTIIEKITNGTTIYKWELNTDEIIIRIPFGNEFILFTIAGIVILLVASRKKINLI
jgi:hypothetical protein